MKTITIVYATTKGQTAKIAGYMRNELKESGFEVHLIDAQSHQTDLAPETDLVIYGGPVYAQRFPKALIQWVRSHHKQLSRPVTAFFSVSLNAADQRASARAADDRLLREFINETGFVPDYIASFAGALKYLSYSWPVRQIMKLISSSAEGGTDTRRDYEYTDWSHVHAFLEAIKTESQDSPFSLKTRFPQYRNMDKVMRSFEQFWEKDVTIYAPPEKVATDFRWEPLSEGKKTRLHSEMRMHSTNKKAARRFKLYWTLLQPGIRHYMSSILSGLKRKTESSI